MAQGIELQSQVMRLAEDLSNIHEFAFFVGGSISSKAGPKQAVALAERNGSVTYVHAGDYALVSPDGEVEKQYAYDFEKSFGQVEGLEESPIKEPYFFQVQNKSYEIKAVIDSDVVVDLIWPVRHAATAKLFKSRAVRKVEANADHASIAKHLPDATYAEFDKLYAHGDVVFKDGSAAVLAYSPEGTGERALFTGISADEIVAVQQWFNRELLLKGQYFMMMIGY